MRSIAARLQMRHLLPLIPLLAFAVLPSAPLRDNSFLWHVRAGTVQASLSRVLVADPFSYTAHGESWRTQSWLADLAYGSAEAVLRAVDWAPALVVVVGVGALAITGLTIYAGSRSVLAVAIGLLVTVWLLAPFALPRPVIFSYLLLALLVLALRVGRAADWVIVPILWVWAGVHGSWFVAVVLVALVAVARRSPRLGLVAGLGALSTGFTAHGIGTWKILLSFLGSAGALAEIPEWQPPDIASVVQFPYLLIAAGLLIAASRSRIEPAELWVVIPFFALGFSANRSIPVAALVLVPFAARAVVGVLPVGRRRPAPILYALLAIACGLVILVHVSGDRGLDRDRFPSDAAIEALDGRRFFHDTAVGGYLIYREGPHDPVYIDDRAELYGALRVREYQRAVDGYYTKLFERVNLTGALTRSSWPLHDRLLEDGWMLAYEDEEFSVLLKPQEG